MEKMTSITVYDGATTIGGNKIYLNENGEGIFLDFGMNFKNYGRYYQEFLSPRSNRGLYDLIHLNLIPKLDIYRKDLIPSDLDVSKYPKLNVSAILLSHAHMDHFGNIGLLNPSYPIIASPSTITLLKGILDCSTTMLGSDVAYYSVKNPKKAGRILDTDRNKDFGRNFISTKKYSKDLTDFLSLRVASKKQYEGGTITTLQNFSSKFEIEAHEVDHSIFGATGYLISKETTIAYTGDFRLHGIQGKKSESFIRKSREASILIIEGTRTAREDISESEEIVYDNCRRSAEIATGLIIADFSARNFERLETFQKIAEKIGRTLVITSKDAYLLSALEKAEGIDRIKDAYVYQALKTTKRNWESVISEEKPNIRYIDPLKISSDPDSYLMCFSLFDVKHLLDINPQNGTYIYSSSEAFEEESEFDFTRLNNWLQYFNFKIYGFEIIEESGRERPEFTKGFHASGHASKNDLKWAVDIIDPDIIIPVHTDNPKWFEETFENTRLIKEGQTFQI